ncbi:hypothetical protein H9L39_18020 [Fusarium oxysporum f. sp. albedinis]|nr:hypothetical protein H9L39_18020 [Fusarium oxysporum f. sp. albedinis]
MVALDDVDARIISRIDGSREEYQISGLGEYGIGSNAVHPADVAWMRYQRKRKVEDRQLPRVNVFCVGEYNSVKNFDNH